MLLGELGTDPTDSFAKLRTEMRAKVALLLSAWNADGVPPRRTAWEFVTARDAIPSPDQVLTIP